MSYIKRLEREAVERRSTGTTPVSGCIHLTIQARKVFEAADGADLQVQDMTRHLGRMLFWVAYVGMYLGYSLDELAGIGLEELVGTVPAPKDIAPGISALSAERILRSSRL